MTNIEKYNSAFISVFPINESVLNDDFSKETIDAWDSVHQLSVVANLEELFDILFEPEDIMALISYREGKEILAKYEIII
jgi:hypothetical protein